MDTEPLLLIAALMLGCAWIAYRGERDQHKRALRELMQRPSDGAAFLSALSAAIYRLDRATGELVQAAKPRKPEPLPGLQVKPRKRAK